MVQRVKEMNVKYPVVRRLGSEVYMVSLPDVLNTMQYWVDHPDGRCRHVAANGFHGIWEARRDSRVRTAMNSADLWIPDGMAPVWVARIKGMRGVQRVPGPEVFEGFFRIAHERGYRSFFLGDTPQTLTQLREALETRFPGHRIVGMYSPPFRPMTPKEDDELLQQIHDAKPDVLWVSLGTPKQDLWIYDHKDRLTAPVVMGVGAAFRFLAGTIKRVPRWVGESGFEWVWRFLMEPKKLWKRDLIYGPQFLIHVTLEMLKVTRYDYPRLREETHHGK